MKGTFFFSIILLAVICSVPLAAQETGGPPAQKRYSWFAAGSVLFFPEKNGIRSDSMPILPVPGAGFSISFFDKFHLETTLDMYFTTYGYDFYLDRAVPRAWENRSAFVWGNVLGVQAAYFWHIRPNISIRAYAGPAIDLRIIFIAPDLDKANNPMDEIKKETNAARRYFWSGGRWLLPVLGTGMDFTLNEKFRLGFDIRVWTPMYKLWTKEDAPIIDGWRFGIGARVTFL